MSVFIPDTKPASATSIAELETCFGKKLPPSYVDFLKKHDGASPAPNFFNLGEANSAGVDEFIPASESKRINEVVDGFPKNAMAIARASGGNFVYLNPANGAIYFWDHEIEDADTKLSDSFEKFLASLLPRDTSQVKLKPGQVKRISGNPDFKPEF